MNSRRLQFLTLVVALLQIHICLAGNGYFYPAPTISQPIPNSGGHHFSPLPTIAPLPSVPALPPLPTARPYVQTQTLVQTHPPPSNQYTASKSIANAYRPPSAGDISKTYLPPNIGQQHQQQQQPLPLPPYIGSRGQFGGPSAPAGPTASYVPTSNPAFPPGSTQTAAQPLRIPFGKQAVVHLPGNEQTYNSGGRPANQYAVVEIIDNDIEENTRPFLMPSALDSIRGQVGASGTGAIASPLGQRYDLGSNALAAAQQSYAQQRASGSDTIALGSGGLGFIRLPNGNVYLGSGSLAYISGQEQLASLHDARTRSGAPMPDALHFGHGPREQITSRFRY